MTTEVLKQFAATEDYLYAENTGIAGAICTEEDRQSVIAILDRCNTPYLLDSEGLEDLLTHHPEFAEELENGCQIYAAEEYEGANKVNTHYIAYYE